MFCLVQNMTFFYDTAREMCFPPCGGRGPVGGQRAARPPLPCYYACPDSRRIRSVGT